MIERRRALRHDISLPVKCNWILKKKRKQDPIGARTVNISANGVMVNSLFSLNEQISVSISLPSLNNPIELKGGGGY